MDEDKAGDNLDVDSIFGKHTPLLERIAVGMGLGSDDGQDILQDIYVEILKRTPEFQEAEQVKRWLMRVTINRCILEFRRRKRRSGKLREIFQRWSARQTAQPGPEKNAIQAEEGRAVRRSLENLNELVRVPLVLKYFCGLNATEIGKVLELKPATVRKRLSDGRIALAKALLELGIKE